MALRNPKGIYKTLSITNNYGEYLMKLDGQSVRLKQIFLDQEKTSQIKEFHQHVALLKVLPFPFTRIYASEVHNYQRCGEKTRLVLRTVIANHHVALSDEITRRKASKLPFSLREVLEVARALQALLDIINTQENDDLFQVFDRLDLNLREAVVVFPDFVVGVSPLAVVSLKTFNRAEISRTKEQIIQDLQEQAYELLVSVLFSGFEGSNYEKLLEEKQNLFEEDINPILASLLKWITSNKSDTLIIPVPESWKSHSPDTNWFGSSELKPEEEVIPQPELDKSPSKINPVTTLKVLNDATFKDFCKNIGVKDFYDFPTDTHSRFPKNFSQDVLENLVIEMVDLSAFVLYDIFNLEWPQLKKLALRACGISDSSIDVILNTKSISNLVSLDLSSDKKCRNTFTFSGLGKIVQNPAFSNLKELILRTCQISTFGMIHICNSPVLSNLEKLDIGEDPSIKPEAFLAINQSPHLLKLKELVVVSLHIGDILCQALLMEGEKTQPKKYEKLTIIDCKLTIVSVFTIFSSPFCTELNVLQLDGNTFNEVKLDKILFEKMKILKLEILSLSACKMFADSFLLILKHVDVAALKDLDLSGNTDLFKHTTAKPFSDIMNVHTLNVSNSGINELSLLELCTFNKKKSVRKLNLSRNQISPLGVELLACSNPFERLEEFQIWDQDDNLFAKLLSTENAKWLNDMYLVFNRMTQKAIVMWNTQNIYLNNLVSLDISFNKIGKSGIHVLTHSEKAKNLKKLVARFSDLDDGSLRMIEHSECLGNLRDVRITRGSITLTGWKHFFHSKFFRQLEIIDLGEFKPEEIHIKHEIYKAMCRESTSHVQIFYSFDKTLL